MHNKHAFIKILIIIFNTRLASLTLLLRNLEESNPILLG